VDQSDLDANTAQIFPDLQVVLKREAREQIEVESVQKRHPLDWALFETCDFLGFYDRRILVSIKLQNPIHMTLLSRFHGKFCFRGMIASGIF